MKRILLALLLICVSLPTFAAENCDAIAKTHEVLDKLNDISEMFIVDNSLVYICDKDMDASECMYDSVILYQDRAVYCADGDFSYTDPWTDLTVNTCSETDLQEYAAGNLQMCGTYLAPTDFIVENGACVCKEEGCNEQPICRLDENQEAVKCLKAIQEGQDAYWNETTKHCSCSDINGIEHNFDTTSGKCVPSPGAAAKKQCDGYSENIKSQKDCKSNEEFTCGKNTDSGCICGKCIPKKESGGDNGSGSDTVGKCHPSVCKSEICRACCAKPSNETIWDRTGQVCQCMNGGKFIKENNQWICKLDSNSENVEKQECDKELLQTAEKWKAQCAGKQTVLSEINALFTYCESDGVKSDVFYRLYDDVKGLVEKNCVDVSGTLPVNDNGAGNVSNAKKRISKLHESLDSMLSGFKRSVWRDKDGDFNTSRLLSDSIAGVVLGTAGGLITSNVVKKNQVEDGFEDIQCTIGGQVVATWGDEFRVGIQ